MPINAQLARFKIAVLVGRSGGAPGFRAGFQEASGLAWQTPAVTFRGGEGRPRVPRKLSERGHVPDITLRRGFAGDFEALRQWLRAGRNDESSALRTVTIQLLGPDDPNRPLQEWQLTNARPVKYLASPLAGRASYAIEELVLASERIDIS